MSLEDAPDGKQHHEGAAARSFDATAYLASVTEDARQDVVTGFPSVDALLGGGFRRGDLIVLGGDVGSGTSALALAMALRALAVGNEVALFSGEFSVPRIFERAIAMEGRVRLDDLRRGALSDEAHAAAAAAALKIRDWNPVFSHIPPNGFGGLSDLLIEHFGLDLIVVDPLEAMATGKMSQEEDLANVVRELKALAVRRNCAVLLTAHAVRNLRERPDQRPQLADFGALGAIRQLADVVLGVFREELYNSIRDVEGAAELHVLKNRNGALGYADLYFYRQWVRFEDMVEPTR